jgi:acyl carrier protein
MLRKIPSLYTKSFIPSINKYGMNSIFNISKKYYHPVRELMKRHSPKFFQDPNVVGEEIIRLISLHDKIKDPSIIKLGSTFEEIGLDSLDMVEIILEIETNWGYDFGPADWEQFITINDIAQFISRDYFGERH